MENISFHQEIQEILTGEFDTEQDYIETVAQDTLLDDYEETYTQIREIINALVFRLQQICLIIYHHTVCI